MSPSLQDIALEVQKLAVEHTAAFQQKLREWAALKKAGFPVLGKAPKHQDRDKLPEAAENLPLLPNNPSVLDGYALIAGFNDSLARADTIFVRLDPWWRWPHVGNDPIAGVGAALMLALRSHATGLSDLDAPRLQQVLEIVRADLLASDEAVPETTELVKSGLWEFQPGLFKFRGKCFDLNPSPQLLLIGFVRSRRPSFDSEFLKEAIGDDMMEQSTMKSHLSVLRSVLRTVAEKFEMGAACRKNPIPRKGGGWRFLFPRMDGKAI